MTTHPSDNMDDPAPPARKRKAPSPTPEEIPPNPRARVSAYIAGYAAATQPRPPIPQPNTTLHAELEVMRTRHEASKAEAQAYEERIRTLTGRAMSAESKLQVTGTHCKTVAVVASTAIERAQSLAKELSNSRVRAEEAEQRAAEAEANAAETAGTAWLALRLADGVRVQAQREV